MKTKNKMLFQYYGGKYKLLPYIFALFPHHENFLELFGGSGCVILNKTPCFGREIYNDIDGNISNLFGVIANDILFPSFLEKISRLPPIDKRLFREYMTNINSGIIEIDLVNRAAKTFYILNLCFSGNFDCENLSAGSYKIKVFNNRQKILNVVHQRFKKIFVENLDFRECLEKCNNKNFLIYADPPYVPETRKSGEYRNEMTIEDHKDLINLLLDFNGKVVLSGYINDLYKKLEEFGWRRFDIKTKVTCSQIRKNADRIESIWLNPQSSEKKGLLF